MLGALPSATIYSQFAAPEAAPTTVASAGGQVPLSLSDTLSIAGGMRFYPLVQCVPQMVVPKDTSFLGTLQHLQTGDVLQVGGGGHAPRLAGGRGCPAHAPCPDSGRAALDHPRCTAHAGVLPLQAQRLRWR